MDTIVDENMVWVFYNKKKYGFAGEKITEVCHIHVDISNNEPQILTTSQEDRNLDKSLKDRKSLLTSSSRDQGSGVLDMITTKS